MRPFRGIFPSHDLEGDSVLDLSLLFAALVYFVLALIVHAVVHWLTRRLRRQEADDRRRPLPGRQRGSAPTRRRSTHAEVAAQEAAAREFAAQQATAQQYAVARAAAQEVVSQQQHHQQTSSPRGRRWHRRLRRRRPRTPPFD